MRTITFQVPDAVDMNDRELVLMFASKLYEQGKLSLGQAAGLVGLSKVAFAEILGNYGVSIINYPPSELSEDLKNA